MAARRERKLVSVSFLNIWDFKFDSRSLYTHEQQQQQQPEVQRIVLLNLSPTLRYSLSIGP